MKLPGWHSECLVNISFKKKKKACNTTLGNGTLENVKKLGLWLASLGLIVCVSVATTVGHCCVITHCIIKPQ